MVIKKYILSAIVISLFCLALFRPNNSFDGIFYTGNVVSFEESNLEIIHTKTFSYLKDFISEKEYDSLKNTSPYQKLQFDNFRSFNEQLSFYKSRILYIAIIFAGYKAGINPFLWGHIFSIICVISGMLIILLKFDIYKSITTSFVLLLASLIAGCGYASRMFSPDTMIFALICLLFYFASSGNFRKFFLLLPLLVLIKPSLILYVFLLILLARNKFKISDKDSLKRYIFFSALLSVLFLAFFQLYYSGFGLSTYFYHSFIGRLNYPLEFNDTISFTDYTSVLSKYLAVLTNNKPFLFFLVISLGIVYYAVSSKEYYFGFYFSLANIAFVLIQFIVFPDIDERFFIGQYVTTFVILLNVFKSNTKKYANIDF